MLRCLSYKNDLVFTYSGDERRICFFFSFSESVRKKRREVEQFLCKEEENGGNEDRKKGYQLVWKFTKKSTSQDLHWEMISA